MFLFSKEARENNREFFADQKLESLRINCVLLEHIFIGLVLR